MPVLVEQEILRVEIVRALHLQPLGCSSLRESPLYDRRQGFDFQTESAGGEMRARSWMGRRYGIGMMTTGVPVG